MATANGAVKMLRERTNEAITVSDQKLLQNSSHVHNIIMMFLCMLGADADDVREKEICSHTHDCTVQYHSYLCMPLCVITSPLRYKLGTELYHTGYYFPLHKKIYVRVSTVWSRNESIMV